MLFTMTAPVNAATFRSYHIPVVFLAERPEVLLLHAFIDVNDSMP